MEEEVREAVAARAVEAVAVVVVEVGEAVAVAAAGDNELVIRNRALGFGESARSKVNIEP